MANQGGHHGAFPQKGTFYWKKSAPCFGGQQDHLPQLLSQEQHDAFFVHMKPSVIQRYAQNETVKLNQPRTGLELKENFPDDAVVYWKNVSSKRLPIIKLVWFFKRDKKKRDRKNEANQGDSAYETNNNSTEFVYIELVCGGGEEIEVCKLPKVTTFGQFWPQIITKCDTLMAGRGYSIKEYNGSSGSYDEVDTAKCGTEEVKFDRIFIVK